MWKFGTENSYELFNSESESLDNPIPVNKSHPKDKGADRVLRYLDCAVIEFTHSFLKSNGEQQFDSVRAAFIEGSPIYPGASFHEKTHIQICIINPDCIKGFFLPRSNKWVSCRSLWNKLTYTTCTTSLRKIKHEQNNWLKATFNSARGKAPGYRFRFVWSPCKGRLFNKFVLVLNCPFRAQIHVLP